MSRRNDTSAVLVGMVAAAGIGLLVSSMVLEGGAERSDASSVAPSAPKAHGRLASPVIQAAEPTESPPGVSQVASRTPVPSEAWPEPPPPAPWPPQGVAPALGVFAVLAVALTDDKAAILATKETISTFPKPMPGDRALGKEKNEAAMNALQEASLEMAIAHLHEGIKADPADPALRNNLGHALLIAGKFEDAKKALIDSITLDPARGTAWAELGRVLAMEGEHDLAAAAFMASVAVSKTEQDAVESLGALSRSNEDRAVRAAAAKALESRTIRGSATAPRT